MFVHLSFSLVGLSEFHAMVTVDVPSETLALLLYAVFLGLGVILLINMLIALLSHTYQKTEVRDYIFFAKGLPRYGCRLQMVSTSVSINAQHLLKSFNKKTVERR